MDTIENLIDELGSSQFLEMPRFTNRELIQISYSNEFETFTNEAWDMVWRVRLPSCQFYIRGRDGYESNHSHQYPNFHAQTQRNAILQAIGYIREIKMLGFELWKE